MGHEGLTAVIQTDLEKGDLIPPPQGLAKVLSEQFHGVHVNPEAGRVVILNQQFPHQPPRALINTKDGTIRLAVDHYAGKVVRALSHVGDEERVVLHRNDHGVERVEAPVIFQIERLFQRLPGEFALRCIHNGANRETNVDHTDFGRERRAVGDWFEQECREMSDMFPHQKPHLGVEYDMLSGMLAGRPDILQKIFGPELLRILDTSKR
ncbi:hypothetical protein KBD59_04750 [Candidatus Gracilibacteria bacterium]|nr:hypothetical protein [Candidatus Gracilibacteria bacterium]